MAGSENVMNWVEAAQKQLEQDERARPWKNTFGDSVATDEKIIVGEETQGQFCLLNENGAA